MKILPSFELSKEGIDPGTDPVSAFLFIWCVSLVYWLRVEEAKSPAFPENLHDIFAKSAVEADVFCKHYGIPTTTFNGYLNRLEFGGNPTDLQEKLNDVLDMVRPYVKKVAADKNVTFDEVALLKALIAWHRSRNPTQLSNVRKLVSRIKMPKILQQYFIKDAGSQDEHVEKLKELVKKLTGKPGLFISMADGPALREKDPETWKAYLAARRAVDTIYKQELHNYVAQKGAPQPISDVRKHLEAKNVLHQLPAKELEGKIDAEGKIYTKHGSRILGVPAAEAKIRMNPEYDPAKDEETGKNNNWVFQTVLPTKDAKGKQNTQYFYTEKKKQINKGHKFDVVQQMLKMESKIVNGWRKDLKSNQAAVAIPAVQCEIMYLTACRIGGDENENKHGKTFGLTTWLVGNVKRKGTALIFDYIGKDSVHQTHRISPSTPAEKRVIEIVELLCEGKKRADELWTYKGKVYNATKLRSYFGKVCTIPDSTPHKIRHLRGTRLAIKVLDPLKEQLLKQRKPITQAQVDKEFKAAMTKVGALLGHVRGVQTEAKATWSTAVQSYVDPGTMIDFYESFEDAGVRVPQFLVKLGR